MRIPEGRPILVILDPTAYDDIDKAKITHVIGYTMQKDQLRKYHQKGKVGVIARINEDGTRTRLLGLENIPKERFERAKFRRKFLEYI